MRTPIKVILALVGTAGAGYGAYRLYKWWKEEDKLEEEGLSYEELVAAKEAADTQKKLDEDAARQEEFAEHLRELDGLPNDGHDWYKTEDGQYIRRELTPFERKNGADYNPLEEEFVSESDIHGNVREYIQKYQEGSKLLNHRDDTYTASDIVNVTREMTAQIRALKRQEMEHDRQIYDPNTQEGYDYYRALVMERFNIMDPETRDKLAILFSWEYIPTRENIGDWNIREDIVRDRTEHFGFGTVYSDWASIGEMVIYFSSRLSSSTGYGTTEQFADWIVDTLGLDLESDQDAIIHDTIVSFVEGHRLGKENVDNTYGLFHLPKDEYVDADTLWHEHNHAISLILDERLQPVFRISDELTEE